MSLYNTRGRKAIDEKMGINMSKDHEVSLQPRLRSLKVLPPDYPESCNGPPFSQSLNCQEFQGNSFKERLCWKIWHKHDKTHLL